MAEGRAATPAALAAYEASLAKDREIVRLLLKTRERLKILFEHTSLTPEAMRRDKAETFAQMRREYAQIRQRWRGDSRYDRTFAKPWNNARLNTVDSYYDLVPGFERLFKAKGGDPERFYGAVAAMGRLTKEQRRQLLR